MQQLNSSWPHVNHTLINNGMPSATCKTFGLGMCLELNLPRHADLIIMEQHMSREEVNKVRGHMCARTYACMHICVCVCERESVCGGVGGRERECVCLCVHVVVYVCVCACARVCVCRV